MASRRTWVWVLVSIAAIGVVALVAIAAAGAYFVASRVSAEPSTRADATRAFDDVTARFPGAAPLYEIEPSERARPIRPLHTIPAAGTAPADLWLLAWDPHEERLVRVSLPFWMLRMHHRQKLTFAPHQSGFDLNRLDLDVEQLERIGSALVVDFRNEDGLRVLVWTQ
jgi:hypothetical protein